jgi:PTH1 family peptidyl-tRNA hydrolase
MKLVVGLGNPGKKYAGTRHNVGFDVLTELVRRTSAPPPKNRFQADVVETRLAGAVTLLLAPLTYMNKSGDAVGAAIDFYKLPLEDLLLVCDDFNLPLGRLRARAKGSAGGQKGLADTIRRLGTEEFPRLRFGIGPVPDRWDPADFVLGKFRSEEMQTVQLAINQAADAVETWIRDGLPACMNQYNASSD